MNEQVDPGVARQAGVMHRTYAAGANPEVVRWISEGPSTVLDLGCGSGGNAAFLATRGATVDGVTLSAAEADHVSRWCRHVAVFNLENGLPPELGGPYDAIICSHVLEHLCFPRQLLVDVRSRLKPGGRLIVAIPNLLVLRNRLDLLLGRFEYQEGGIMDDTHFRWYTLQTLTRLLQAAQFTIAEAYGAGNVPLGPLRRFAPELCRKIDRAACDSLPGLFGWQLVTVAFRA